MKFVASHRRRFQLLLWQVAESPCIARSAAARESSSQHLHGSHAQTPAISPISTHCMHIHFQPWHEDWNSLASTSELIKPCFLFSCYRASAFCSNGRVMICDPDHTSWPSIRRTYCWLVTDSIALSVRCARRRDLARFSCPTSFRPTANVPNRTALFLYNPPLTEDLLDSRR